MVGLDENILAVIAVPVVLIILCMCVQFIMRSRQVGRKQEEKADEKKLQISRETEVEKARMLLDDDDLEESEDVFDYDDDDDPEDELEDPAGSDPETDLEEDEDFQIIE